LQRRRSLYRELGDERGSARILVALGLRRGLKTRRSTRSVRGEPGYLPEADDTDGEWIVLNNLGELERTEANYDRAAELLRRAIVLGTQNDDASDVAVLARACRRRVRPPDLAEASAATARRSSAGVRWAGSLLNHCHCLAGLAAVAALVEPRGPGDSGEPSKRSRRASERHCRTRLVLATGVRWKPWTRRRLA
jgi:hypothetical protein